MFRYNLQRQTYIFRICRKENYTNASDLSAIPHAEGYGHIKLDAFEEIANGLTHSAISSTRTRKTKSSGVNDIDHCTILCYEEDIIVKSSKKYIRKERINGCISELQPQCILLKFPSFQLAYIAKSRLERYLSLQWPSFISFDTYRCTLHNGS